MESPLMRILMAQLWLILVLSLCSHFALAQSCSADDLTCYRPCNVVLSETYKPYWSVSSQEDLDGLTPTDCNLIDGSIQIEFAFTGMFILDRIRTITGSISYGVGFFMSNDPSLDGLSMPDLMSVHNIEIHSMSLSTVQMPKLRDAASIIFTHNRTADIAFPELVNATKISISGPTNSVNFASLSYIQNSLDITNGQVEWYPWTYESTGTLALIFPSLVDASTIILKGALGEVSLPRLATVRYPSEPAESDGIKIDSFGPPIDASLPSLTTSSIVYIGGRINNISMTLLQVVSSYSQINSVTAVSLDFTSLNSVTYLSASGNITDVQFPSLRNITSLHIDTWSPSNFSCTSSRQLFESIRNTTEGYRCIRRADWVESTTAPTGYLGGGAKFGIAFGALFAGGLLLICIYGVVWRWNKNRQLAKGPMNTNELQNRHRTRTDNRHSAVPDWSSTAGTEIGSIGSDDTIVEPPGYIAGRPGRLRSSNSSRSSRLLGRQW